MANSREEGQKQIRHRHHYRQRVVTDFTRATNAPNYIRRCKAYVQLLSFIYTELIISNVKGISYFEEFVHVTTRRHVAFLLLSFREYSSPGPDERCSRAESWGVAPLTKSLNIGRTGHRPLIAVPVSQRFGHPRVLGIPRPKSLAFWASPVGDAQNADRFDFAYKIISDWGKVGTVNHEFTAEQCRCVWFKKPFKIILGYFRPRKYNSRGRK